MGILQLLYNKFVYYFLMVDYRQPFQQLPPEGTLRQSDYKTSFQAKKQRKCCECYGKKKIYGASYQIWNLLVSLLAKRVQENYLEGVSCQTTAVYTVVFALVLTIRNLVASFEPNLKLIVLVKMCATVLSIKCYFDMYILSFLLKAEGNIQTFLFMSFMLQIILIFATQVNDIPSRQ